MKRGANVSLTREIPGLQGVVLGVRFAAGSEQRLLDQIVAATVLCGGNGQAVSDEHFVFFNQLSSPDGSVTQQVAVKGSDTEQIEVDLAAVPDDVARIVLVAYLNDPTSSRRTLGQLRECTIRVLDLDGDTELVRSENLAPALTTETALVLGELYRSGSGWKFKVIGLGYDKGIVAVARDYGVTV